MLFVSHIDPSIFLRTLDCSLAKLGTGIKFIHIILRAPVVSGFLIFAEPENVFNGRTNPLDDDRGVIRDRKLVCCLYIVNDVYFKSVATRTTRSKLDSYVVGQLAHVAAYVVPTEGQ